MSDQQNLVNRIVELAAAISLTQFRFVDVRYDGAANQLHIAILNRNGSIRSKDVVDLHEPGEAEIARKRVNQRLLEVVTHLESLQAKPLQRSFSL